MTCGLTPIRTVRVLALFSMVAALAACGGGGGGGGDTGSSDGGVGGADGGGSDSTAPTPAVAASAPAATAPAPAVPPPPPTQAVTSAARVAGVDLVQSFVYPSTDSALLLVADRDVIVKVNVTTTEPAKSPPAGTLRIEDGNGALVEELALTVPTAALQATVPVVPDFAHFYTATVPASAVKTGLRLTVQLQNGQPSTVVTPRVGGSNAITFVAVPLRIQSTTGQVFAASGAYIAALAPLSTVTMTTHAVYTSQKVTALPTSESQWETAMGDMLDELATLHSLENASDRTYYYGFLPKRTFGVAGLGHTPGHVAVGMDMPAQPDVTISTLLHEVGHNFSLQHAPCGVDDPDPEYPYANAALGAGNRFIWGYDKRRNVFIDPRPTDRHDLMSYCDGLTFSDFNYRRIQSYLTPADRASAVGAASVKSATAPRELLLITGRIFGDHAELGPVKAFTGTPGGLAPGAYVLRIETAAGTVEHRFAPLALDHATAYLPFQISIPNPGRIASMQVLSADGKVLAERRAGASMATDRAKASATPAVSAAEADGMLRLRWDAASYPWLTVIHVGGSRNVLAQDLPAGTAELHTTSLEAGGSFELILSDGLNSMRVTVPRGAAGSTMN